MEAIQGENGLDEEELGSSPDPPATGGENPTDGYSDREHFLLFRGPPNHSRRPLLLPLPLPTTGKKAGFTSCQRGP